MRGASIIDFESFDLPVPSGEYGRNWKTPNGDTPQIVRELLGFKLNGKQAGFESRFIHGLKLIQLIWGNEHVWIYKTVIDYRDGREVRIWNTYFLRAFKALCHGKKTAFTGCSSSGKTFACAVYALLMFMSDPMNTTIMISTTAATDAERRVWGEIKRLHTVADKVFPVGKLIDFLKVITFNPSEEIMGKKSLDMRDLANGIILIPIPKGAEGDNALGKVIGTKNKKIIWIIDEMPNMIPHILRAESNILSVRFLQIVGIGNAASRTDAHGMMCEPEDGWDSITEDSDEWTGVGGTLVVFFHGEKSPNFNESVNPQLEDAEDYPFPDLSRPSYIRAVEKVNSRGGINGRKTLDFMRFAIGFWAGDDISRSIVTTGLVRQFMASSRPESWGIKPRVIAGFDPGFTSGGDSCELTFISIGRDHSGRWQASCPQDTIKIVSEATDRESFQKSIAKQVVSTCINIGCKPEDFYMDTSGDGGIIGVAISVEWGGAPIVMLSSSAPSSNSKRFANMVTQYWFQVQDFLRSLRVRGWNTASKYHSDLSKREYSPVAAGKVIVEKKKDFKKRLGGKSPDSGDSFTYAVEGVKRAGFPFEGDPAPETRHLVRPFGPDTDFDSLNDQGMGFSDHDVDIGMSFASQAGDN